MRGTFPLLLSFITIIRQYALEGGIFATNRMDSCLDTPPAAPALTCIMSAEKVKRELLAFDELVGAGKTGITHGPTISWLCERVEFEEDGVSAYRMSAARASALFSLADMDGDHTLNDIEFLVLICAARK